MLASVPVRQAKSLCRSADGAQLSGGFHQKTRQHTVPQVTDRSISAMSTNRQKHLHTTNNSRPCDAMRNSVVVSLLSLRRQVLESKVSLNVRTHCHFLAIRKSKHSAMDPHNEYGRSVQAVSFLPDLSRSLRGAWLLPSGLLEEADRAQAENPTLTAQQCWEQLGAV